MILFIIWKKRGVSQLPEFDKDTLNIVKKTPEMNYKHIFKSILKKINIIHILNFYRKIVMLFII